MTGLWRLATRRLWFTALVSVVVIAALVALALTGIARGRASSAGPHYAYPPRPCGLISPATMAKYLPGPQHPFSVPAPDVPGSPRVSGCELILPENVVSLFLWIYLYGPAGPTAQQGYGFLVRDRGSGRPQVTPRLGPAATATAFLDSPSDGHQVDLLAWSGNAVVEVQLIYPTARRPAPSGATQLAAATAVVHDVLTTLPGT